MTRRGEKINHPSSASLLLCGKTPSPMKLRALLPFLATSTAALAAEPPVPQFRGVTESDVTRSAISKPEPLRIEHENFRDAVLGKDSDIVTMEQGARVVEVCEAMIESGKTGKFISLV